ncbi:hypothetical protein AB0H37_14655 [Actinomadura sp. NPDC023710]|uniref:hypothetical protein n=1 Tax=Actinomadura sp. NPDC023710 TaxID=3158219 RepID=UPI0033E4C0BE
MAQSTKDVLSTMLAATASARTAYATAKTERGLNRVPGSARDLVQAVERRLAEVESLMQSAGASVPSIMSNVRVYPEGRKAAAQAAVANVERDIAEKTAAAEEAIIAARGVLTAAALRRIDPKREALARQDAMMILDRADPRTRAEVMSRLAARQDDVGALVASEWGRDYLTATGEPAPLVEASHTLTVRAAIEAAAAQDIDAERREAALHLDTLDNLHGVRDSVTLGAREVIESLRSEYDLSSEPRDDVSEDDVKAMGGEPAPMQF